MSITSRLDGYQRRHPKAGFPIAVVYKYFDDQGGYLAALITYYGFLSLIPLLLLMSTILGFVLAGDPQAQHVVLNSALSQFPVIGQQLQEPQRIGGGVAGLVIGILGALYGALGVAQALQNAMNIAWAVPRNERPNPFKARARSLLLLATVGLAVPGAAAVSAVSAGAGKVGASLGSGAHTLLDLLLVAASVAVNAAAFIFAFRIATARPLTVRQIAPGALGAAVVWQLLQSFGATYVKHVIANASATNAVFALVLGLIAFIYVAAVAVVVCIEVNVVRVNKLHPRALLTPFTDNVELTPGDEAVYTDQAEAQRTKGFEQVDVSFDR